MFSTQYFRQKGEAFRQYRITAANSTPGRQLGIQRTDSQSGASLLYKALPRSAHALCIIHAACKSTHAIPYPIEFSVCTLAVVVLYYY